MYHLVCDCHRYMQEGSDFLKVRSYARQFRRLYKLNDTLTAISWYPTSKKPSKATSNQLIPFYIVILFLFSFSRLFSYD